MTKTKVFFAQLIPAKLKIPSFLLVFSVLTMSCFMASAQNISGIVNTYYRVTEVVPAKACVRVNTTAGLGYNDKVMLIQMKGASINTTDVNAVNFGDTTGLNNAGNYEIATVCYLNGDSVFFVFNMLNQYTTAGKVQLVKMPRYSSATVTDTLKAAPWNNTAGTGGVLAIYIDQTLTLNAPIYADSSGYRGGSFRLSSDGCSNTPGAQAYAYNGNSLSPQNGALKGEGVADITNVAHTGGRGAVANGGGGGNNHNNGGAGGGNLTSGGDGGGNSSAGTFNCKLSLFGRAGKALSSYGGSKIFAGGGGGSGHINNGYVTSYGGGHGGGIIFIRANSLVGNNKKISANGQTGGPAASDGGSGGGAGGTIIMAVANYGGTVTIEANGGGGGLEADGGNINYCYGAGGGGSAGAIYFSTATPASPVAATVTGGPMGPETGRDVSCGAVVLSRAGNDGVITPSYSYRRSNVLATNACSIPLPVEFEWFNAGYTNGQAVLNWKITQPEMIDRFLIERYDDDNNWIKVGEKSANDIFDSYEAIDPSPMPGYNFYRIRVIKKTTETIYSSSKKIYVTPKHEQVNIYPNPAGQKIFITGLTSSPTMELLDLSGKMIMQKKIIGNQNITEVTLPKLPAGIYVIKLDDVKRRLIIR
jgi:hypothetical protein